MSLDKIKRLMIESTNVDSNTSISKVDKPVYSNSSIDGRRLGIFLEGRSYVIYLIQEIDMSSKQEVKTASNSKVLIEGKSKKSKYTYGNFNKAKLQLDLIIHNMNESVESINKIELFNNVTGSEKQYNEDLTYNVFEDEKFVLKVDTPESNDDSLSTDSFDEDLGGGFVDDFEVSGDDTDDSFEDMIGDESDSFEDDIDTDESQPTEKGENDADDKKSIQKWTGKLAQKLRDYTNTDRDEMDNYVFKSIAAAIDWANITQDELDDYISALEEKFEENSQEGDIGETTDDLETDISLDDDSFEDDPFNDELGDDDILESITLSDLDTIFEKNGYCNKHNKLLSECGCGCNKDKEGEYDDDEKNSYYELEIED